MGYMTRPIIQKFNLWRDRNKGLKNRLSSDLKDSALDRTDVATINVREKMDRGGRVQKARLERYPSIDVNKDNLYAGEIEGDKEDAIDLLEDLGFRNNPTAYVEITEEDGPDDGSFAKQFITESGQTGSKDIPVLLGGMPQLYRRVKEQVHVVIFVQEDTVEFLAHREQSTFLQPMRHVIVNNASARKGVRDFRNAFYDEAGMELGGKQNVKWDVVH